MPACSANSADSYYFTHVVVGNGFDSVLVGLKMAIGEKTGNKRRDFGAVCRNQETIPNCQA